MQEEARIKQSLFEYRQNLTCCSGQRSPVYLSSVQPAGALGTEAQAGSCSVSVVGSRHRMGPSSVTVHPSSRLPQACPQDC